MTEYDRIIRDHQKSAPVGVVGIAHDLGLKVYESPNFSDNISGHIAKKDDRYAIYVNKHHSDKRKRFTIAHEIAHYCRHQKHIGDGLTDDYLYRSDLTNAQEREANQYAAEILMPLHLLKEKDYKNSTIFKLAQIFNVSEQAMSIRLRNLGVSIPEY